MKDENLDSKVVEDFGKEWSSYSQDELPKRESEEEFLNYSKIFPFNIIGTNSVGADFGCGSGRWAKHFAPKCKKLHCIDPSDAINVAKKNLRNFQNISFEKSSISTNSIEDESLDFAYCLGVLHHTPDPELSMKDCVLKLKQGAPFLIYVYYRFDNQPVWYKWIWIISDLMRRLICRLPHKIKLLITLFVAFFVYLPFSRSSLLLEKLRFDVKSWPLSHYRNKSFYSLKTDALDRFGTKLEFRYTKKEIKEMMQRQGLKDIKFSEGPPFWCAVGYKG